MTLSHLNLDLNNKVGASASAWILSLICKRNQLESASHKYFMVIFEAKCRMMMMFLFLYLLSIVWIRSGMQLRWLDQGLKTSWKLWPANIDRHYHSWPGQIWIQGVFTTSSADEKKISALDARSSHNTNLIWPYIKLIKFTQIHLKAAIS